MLNTTSPTIWEYPYIVTLEEQLVKARSSMALRTYLMYFSIRAYPHKVEEILFILHIVEFFLNQWLGDFITRPISSGNIDRYFTLKCLKYF